MLFESDRVFLMVKILISSAMMLLMMASLTDFKYTKRRIIIAYSVYLIYALISSWVIVGLGGWTAVLKLFTLTLVIPAVILTYLVANNHSMQAVFNHMTQLNIFLILSATVTLFNEVLHGNEITDLIGRFLLLGAAVVVEYRFLRRPFRKIADSLDKNWLPMALIPVAFLILILFCALYPVHYTQNPWGVVQLYIICFVMMVVYYVVFQSLFKSYRLLEQRLEKDVMNAQLYAQKQYYEALFLREQETSERDMFIQTLLRENQVTEATAMLEKWNAKRSTSIYCTNVYINAVVELFAACFEEQHIPFFFDLQIGSAQLHDAEVFLILNNALENALEASLRMPVEKRMIKVQSKIVQGQFLIQIRNRFNGKLIRSMDLPRSLKQEQGHGYGLSSIRAAAERADGYMSFRVEKDDFVLDVQTQIKTVNK